MNQNKKMQQLIKILELNKGFAKMNTFRQAGIQTRDVAKALKENIIIKIKPGLYKLVNYPWDEHSSFVDVSISNNRAVICLLSAADFYQYTTFNPVEIYVAVPNNTDKFLIQTSPIKLFYFSDKSYSLGIDEIETKSGTFKIYNKEKTIVDLFRYMNKIGDDVVVESLKSYLNNRRERKIQKLFEYSENFRIRNKIEPMVKAFLS